MTSEEREERNQRIGRYIEMNPLATFDQIAKEFGMSQSMIQRIVEIYDFDYKSKKSLSEAQLKGTYPFNEPCIDCYYWRRLNEISTGFTPFTRKSHYCDYSISYSPACHYCIETGHLRECPPETCNKFKPKSTHKRKTKQYIPYKEQIEKRNKDIYEQYKNGKSKSEISRNFGLSWLTIHKIIKEEEINDESAR